MANARRGGARTSKSKKKPAPSELDPRFLWTRLVWLALAVGWLLTATALISFDAGDAPSHAVWPHNTPTRNWIGVVGAHTAYAILKLVGLGAVPAMLAWLLALVWSASGRAFRHPFVRSAGAVLVIAAIAALAQVILGDGGPMPGLAGGIVGVSAGSELLIHTGTVGSVLILLAVLVAGLILSFDRLVFVVAGWVASLFMTSAQRAQAAAKKRADEKKKRARRVRQTDLDDAEIEIKQGSAARKWTLRERISEMAGGLGGGERFDPDLETVDPDEVEEEWDDAVAEDAIDEEGDEEEWDEEDEEAEEEEDAEDEYEYEYEDDEQEDEEPAPAGADQEDEEDELPGAPQIFDRDKLKEKISALPVRFASADKGSATQEDLDAYQQNAEVMEGYKFPTLELLEEPDEGFNEKLEEMVREQAEALEEALQEYRLKGEVVGIESGPVITLYHVKLAPGTKVAALNAISSDLARALKSVNIRIVPNMAGRDTVGIEVPNATKEKVRLKELMRNRRAASRR
jgi:S-DNA-T family DNA segregation ATPase FtsK/SpoIIIE